MDKIVDIFEEYVKYGSHENLERGFIFLFDHCPPIFDFLPMEYKFFAEARRFELLVKNKLLDSFFYKISDCYGEMAERETNQEKRDLLSRIQAIINTIKR